MGNDRTSASGSCFCLSRSLCLWLVGSAKLGSGQISIKGRMLPEKLIIQRPQSSLLLFAMTIFRAGFTPTLPLIYAKKTCKLNIVVFGSIVCVILPVRSEGGGWIPQLSPPCARALGTGRRAQDHLTSRLCRVKPTGYKLFKKPGQSLTRHCLPTRPPSGLRAKDICLLLTLGLIQPTMENAEAPPPKCRNLRESL